jgi:hypothetical protein
MGVFRSYFTKDNVLIKNKYVNTGLNPVVELFYGTSEKLYDRYIFDFDITDIKNRINDYRIPDNGSIKHYLKMTNTLLYDKSLLGYQDSNKDHASSFDLVLFRVPESWDEGVGYDYDYNNTILDINPKIYETSSNWFQRTDITNWSENGIYSGTTSDRYIPLNTIHFDLGNEDIELDITSTVQGLISSGTTNFYGLGLAFLETYENMNTDKLYSVGFFSKDTNTFFEPFIETVWYDTIKDDRKEFFYDIPNKLYLYTNIKKEPKNLDSLPSAVIIRDSDDNVINTLTGITHESKGVYSIGLTLNSSDFNNNTLINFTDTWSGLTMNGVNLPDVQMEFTVREQNYYNIGNEVYEPDDYTFNFSGIKRGERIPQGEVRKILVIVKEMYNYNDTLIIDNLSYRIYIRQGRNQIDIIKSADIHRAFNQNYFYLDTSWMIPQEYSLEIILESNGTITKKDDIDFVIVDSYYGNINFTI